MENELLRCPFCDGEGLPRKALRDGYAGDWENDPDAYAYFIICRACACQGGWAKSEGSAIKLWNLRVTLSPALSHSEGEPDHKAMWDTITKSLGWSEGEVKLLKNPSPFERGGLKAIQEIIAAAKRIEAKHTPAGAEKEKSEEKDD